MPRKEILETIQKYIDPFRVTKGKGLQLKDFDPGDTRGLEMDKGDAAELLQRGSQWLATEQDMLYAQDRWSLLLIFQAMDAAGKDGTIAHDHVGRESSRMPSVFFQAAFCGRTGSRFHVALRQSRSGTRSDRHLQSVLLRRGPRCPSPQGAN
jgi:hypothetical protein